MPTKIFTSLLILLTLNLFTSCQEGSAGIPDEFDYGKVVDGNTYSNKFFKLKVPFPTDWSLQNKEQMDQLMDMGAEVISGDNKSMKAMLKASEINTAPLLSLFKYEVGSTMEFNPSFQMIAENLKMFPGIKSGEDYLNNSKQLMKQAQMDFDFGRISSKDIGGREFDSMRASTKVLDYEIIQEYASTVMNGFSLSIVMSYTNDSEKEELYNILNQMRFLK